MDSVQFTLPQILAFVGLLQCLYIILFMVIKARHWLNAGLPILYFSVLGAAFLVGMIDTKLNWPQDTEFFVQWFLWFLGPPLSVLLIIQLADFSRPPPKSDVWVLLLLPMSFLISLAAVNTIDACAIEFPCDELEQMLNVTGLMAGTISLLLIFSKKDLLKNLLRQKKGRARYWLALSLILLNVFFLNAVLFTLTGHISADDLPAIRNILGLGFVYLASTSVLRIFPVMPKTGIPSEAGLNAEELRIAHDIETLLKREKVYQEPTYSRSDLAKECKAAEAAVSKVINAYFGKSFPQLFNEHRIEDAKRLLSQTDAPIAVIASEVGFNSLPSFNRVFKDMTGDSPSGFRKQPLNS